MNKCRTVLQIYPSSSLVGGAAKSNILVSTILRDHGYRVIPLIGVSKRRNELSRYLQKLHFKTKKLILLQSIFPDSFRDLKEKYLFFIKVFLKYIFFVPNELAVFIWLVFHNDAIVYYGGSNLIQGYFAARLLHRPYVVHVREYVEEDQHWKFLFPKHQKRFFENSLKVLCVSDNLLENFMSKYPNAEAQTVYNAVFSENEIVEHREHKTLSLNKTNLLVVGSISKHKGQDQAISALKFLKQENEEFTLTIVGEASKSEIPYFKKIQESVDLFGLKDDVHFVGYQKDPLVYFNSADILLVCSECEAFGRVTIEAASCGCIIVGADTGATVELIEKMGGRTYKYGDSKDLAIKILEVVENKDYYRKVALRGSHIARSEFSTENLSANLMSVFDSL